MHSAAYRWPFGPIPMGARSPAHISPTRARHGPKYYWARDGTGTIAGPCLGLNPSPWTRPSTAQADRSIMLQKSIMHVLTQWWMIIANKQKNVKCLCFFEFSTIIPMFFYVISLSHPMPSACPPGPTTISPPLHPRKCETTCTCDHRIYLSRWFLSIQPLIHPTYPMYDVPSPIHDQR